MATTVIEHRHALPSRLHVLASWTGLDTCLHAVRLLPWLAVTAGLQTEVRHT